MHMILVVVSTGVAQLLAKMNVVHFTMPMEPPQHGLMMSLYHLASRGRVQIALPNYCPSNCRTSLERRVW